MRAPDLNQLRHELQKNIENLSVVELKKVIYAIAENTPVTGRYSLLNTILYTLGKDKPFAHNTSAANPKVSPEDLFNSIENYKERMERGDFFDEEKNYEAYDREEHSYYRRDYNDYFEEDTNFSTEGYVTDMANMLGHAEHFCAKGDFTTAYEAYHRLFEIMENDEEAGSNEHFIYGFSFEESIGEEEYKMHLILYYRLFYLHHVNINREAVFAMFCRRSDIYLSDIADGASPALENMDKFTDGFISFLEERLNYGLNSKRLVDALMVKGEDVLKVYAYKKGQNFPPAFLAYYQKQKGKNIPSEELKQLILDGLRIIPEQYASRSILSTGLIETAIMEKNDDLLEVTYT